MKRHEDLPRADVFLVMPWTRSSAQRLTQKRGRNHHSPDFRGVIEQLRTVALLPASEEGIGGAKPCDETDRFTSRRRLTSPTIPRRLRPG